MLSKSTPCCLVCRRHFYSGTAWLTRATRKRGKMRSDELGEHVSFLFIFYLLNSSSSPLPLPPPSGPTSPSVDSLRNLEAAPRRRPHGTSYMLTRMPSRTNIQPEMASRDPGSQDGLGQARYRCFTPSGECMIDHGGSGLELTTRRRT